MTERQPINHEIIVTAKTNNLLGAQKEGLDPTPAMLDLLTTLQAGGEPALNA